jgi:hypothetical protein
MLLSDWQLERPLDRLAPCPPARPPPDATGVPHPACQHYRPGRAWRPAAVGAVSNWVMMGLSRGVWCRQYQEGSSSTLKHALGVVERLQNQIYTVRAEKDRFEER